MRLTLSIDCETDAFNPLPHSELARILRDLAISIEVRTGSSLQGLKLKDRDGNTVGAVQVSIR